MRCFYHQGADAEEVLQEVFLKVAEKLDSFRRESCPVTWLYCVTTNHCISRLRKSKRRSELLAEHAADFVPTSSLARQEQRACLQQLLELEAYEDDEEDEAVELLIDLYDPSMALFDADCSGDLGEWGETCPSGSLADVCPGWSCAQPGSGSCAYAFCCEDDEDEDD